MANAGSFGVAQDRLFGCAQDDTGFGGSAKTGKRKDEIQGSFATLKDDDVKHSTASATADPCGMTNKGTGNGNGNGNGNSNSNDNGNDKGNRQRQRRNAGIRSTALLTKCCEQLRSG
jgi:hypothetical protein